MLLRADAKTPQPPIFVRKIEPVWREFHRDWSRFFANNYARDDRINFHVPFCTQVPVYYTQNNSFERILNAWRNFENVGTLSRKKLCGTGFENQIEENQVS